MPELDEHPVLITIEALRTIEVECTLAIYSDTVDCRETRKNTNTHSQRGSFTRGIKYRLGSAMQVAQTACEQATFL